MGTSLECGNDGRIGVASPAERLDGAADPTGCGLDRHHRLAELAQGCLSSCLLAAQPRLHRSGRHLLIVAMPRATLGEPWGVLDERRDHPHSTQPGSEADRTTEAYAHAHVFDDLAGGSTGAGRVAGASPSTEAASQRSWLLRYAESGKRHCEPFA